MVIVGGIDPSSSPKRPSGIAIVSKDNILFIAKVYYDSEIIGVIKEYKPIVVAIDSPLSHNKGFRKVDIEMKKHGYPVLPPNWPAMIKLIDRSLKLVEQIRSLGVEVIETHPKSALKSSGCKSIEELVLQRYRDHELVERISNCTKDEKDALIAALVALDYIESRATVIKASDETIYLLSKSCNIE